MRGLILTSLKQFVTTTYGESAWTQLLVDTGLTGRTYLVSDSYPDSDATALVGAASRMTGVPANDLLRSFGQALVPTLLHTYRAFIKPHWRTLDMIERVETQMHKAVRLRDREASPPPLRAIRTSASEVTVRYDSPRRLCALAEGIVAGIAEHYGEPIELRHPTCMLRGDSECTLIVVAKN